MKTCKDNDLCLIERVEDAVGEFSQEGAADIFVNNRINVRASLDGSKACIYGAKKLITETLDVGLIPCISASASSSAASGRERSCLVTGSS